MRAVIRFLKGEAARRLGVSLLLSVFLIGGSVASVQTGLTLDDPTEQMTFRIITGAAKSLFLGHLDEFNQLQSYNDRYYGIGFYAVAYPFQVLLQPYLARTLGVDSETALLLGKHPVVFLLFVISVVVFYRVARFFIRERPIAIAISAAYAAYPYLFGHALINVKDSPFMSVYLICTYLSLRLVKRHLRRRADWFRTDVAGLALATAALVSIRIPGLMILLQYAFTFGLADRSELGARGTSARFLHWRNLAWFSALLIPLVVLSYPAFWINPVREAFAALKYMGWYPQPGCTLTWGLCMKPYATPSYLSGWLVVKLPTLILIGVVLVPFALKKIVRDPFQRIAYFALLFGSLYVLIAIMALRARLYDETRQLLFIYPLLFLLGSIAIYFASRKLALTAALLSFAIFAWDQVHLHPYQYVYFNEIARFLNIDELFETDYWGTSGREHGTLLGHDLHDLRAMKGLTCMYAVPLPVYRPFIDSRVCVEPLNVLTEYPPNNSYVIAITCTPGRLKMPANCYQLSAITRTLPLSGRKITMAAAYYCSQ